MLLSAKSFDFVPKLLFIAPSATFSSGNNPTNIAIFVHGGTRYLSFAAANSYNEEYYGGGAVTWNGITVSWWAYINERFQENDTFEYYYTAIG